MSLNNAGHRSLRMQAIQERKPAASYGAKKLSFDALVDRFLPDISPEDYNVEPSKVTNVNVSFQNELKESQDLISSMASRITNLEISKRDLRTQLVHAEKKNLAMQNEIHNLHGSIGAQAISEENARLKIEIEDMKKFLSDYGLVWCGDSPPADVDIPSLLEALTNLSSPNFQVSKLSNNIHSLKPVMVRLKVFSNGLLIRQGPFRPYESAASFIQDGYFPSEFKEQYPDGLNFDVYDCSHEEFHESELDLASLTQNIPKVLIAKSGQVMNPQLNMSLNELCPIVIKSPQVEANEGAFDCEIRIRTGGGSSNASVILQLMQSDRISMAKDLLKGTRYFQEEDFDLRCGISKKTYSGSETVLQAGWCPNISLFVVPI